MKHRIFALLAVVSALAAGPLRADDAVGTVIAKARAYLGTESALNAVQVVHFTGQLKAGTDPEVPVDIVFQKPYEQRIVVMGPKAIEVTALDDYDAWHKKTNPANHAQWQVTLLDANQVKRLRANTWENLNFFTGIEKKGGKVQAMGDATVDGIACAKLAFIHADDIVFVRYFDKATGRLVKTETENGGEIREEGEIMVNGVRFPRKVINRAPNVPTTTIVFDKIEMGSPLPVSEFAVPAFRGN